jgi:predicted O-methyltransferase YrrM
MKQLNALESQFLTSTGWLRSVHEQAAVDADGPVPWFTYPAIRQLERMVSPQWRVLEFGSGFSTLWWAQRVAEVVSVEHDPGWAARLRAAGPSNVTVCHRVMDDPVRDDLEDLLLAEYFPSGCFGSPTDDPTRNYRAGLLDAAYRAYAATALEYPQGHFDVIVVDGMARALTAWVAARQVATGGLVVFDNSDRHEYAAAYKMLEANGFARLDYWGLGPINPYEWCTSIFVRSLDAFRTRALP